MHGKQEGFECEFLTRVVWQAIGDDPKRDSRQDKKEGQPMECLCDRAIAAGGIGCGHENVSEVGHWYK